MGDVRVVLADDHALTRAGLRVVLDSEPGITVVGEASDGAEAVAVVSRLAPDVICMDVQMPGIDGLEATRRIVADPALTTAVLVLTTFNRDDYLFEALRAGAAGFLLKNASPERLIEAVQTLASGDALLSPEVTRHVIERAVAARNAPRDEDSSAEGRSVDRSIAPVTDDPRASDGGHAPLTPREAEVLALVAKGMSNAEIGGLLFVGESTVKTHVSNILAKLGVRDRIHAVIYAFERRIVR